MVVSEFIDRVRLLSPDRPIRTLWRSAGYKLRPPRPATYTPVVTWRQDALLANGEARSDQRAHLLREQRPGPVPTIVIGGFVPDATESVYLVRGMLLRHGSVYYFNFPPGGFSTKLFLAQLEDLVEELTTIHEAPPVVLTISFGCGLLLEWLRRARRGDETVSLRGVVMISPVTCTADVLEPGAAKPSTLLGRALLPFMSVSQPITDRQIERCRSLLLRMFEAGAQNKQAVRALLTRGELLHLRHRVMGTLRNITVGGALERVRALIGMEPPSGYFTQAIAPLCEAPTLILFAEKESSVLTATAPSAHLAQHAAALFPSAQVRTVVAHRGSPVQHASLIFHAFNFLPPLSSYYQRLRKHVALEQRWIGPRRWRIPLRPGEAA